MTEYRRLFIGGLPKDIQDTDIRERFCKFGDIDDVEVKTKYDSTGDWVKTFAYINIHINNPSLNKCKTQLHGARWKGGVISIQNAKEDVTKRYEKERIAANVEKTEVDDKTVKNHQVPTEVKGAVPGTRVPDIKDWVVTKFQRVMPVMKVRSKDNRKVLKYDPSKHCHQLKRLTANVKNAKDNEEEDANDCSISTLTWQMSEQEVDTYKKRIGDFDDSYEHHSWKTSRGRSAMDIMQIEEEKRKDLEQQANDFEVVSTNYSSVSPYDNDGQFSSTGYHSSDSDNLQTPNKKMKKAKASKNLSSIKKNIKKSNKRKKEKRQNGVDHSDSCDTDDILSHQNVKTNEAPPLRARSMSLDDSSSSSSESDDSTSELKPKLGKFPGTAALTNLEKADNLEKNDSVVNSKLKINKSAEKRQTNPKKSMAQKSAIASSSDSSTESDSDSSAKESKPPGTSGQRQPLSVKNFNMENKISTALQRSSSSSESEIESDSQDSSGHNTRLETSKQKKLKSAKKNPQIKVKVSQQTDSENESTSDSDDNVDNSIRHSSERHLDLLDKKSNVPIKPGRLEASQVKSGVTKETKMDSKRQAESNAKRIETMKIRQAELKEQQRQIQNSLKNLDQPSSKRKIFDSDSDDAELESSELQTKDQKGLTLFNDDQDSSEEEDYDAQFAVKPQFEGSKGAKLLSLQKSYQGDDRFKLTDKFIESDSEDSSEENKNEDPEDKSEVVDERRKNLEILQSIVGNKNVRIEQRNTVNSKKPTGTSAAMFRDVSKLHYDPTDSQFEHMERKIDTSQKTPKRKRKLEGSDPVASAEPAPDVSKEKFYEVNVNFNDQLKKSNNTENGTFNFNVDGSESAERSSSHAFGFFNVSKSDEESVSASSEDEQSEMENSKAGNETNKSDQNKDPLDNNVTASDGEYSSADENKPNTVSNKEMPGSSQVSAVVDLFFFTEDDPRLKDGSSRFSSSMDDRELRKRWEKIRPQLVEDYLQKIRRVGKANDYERQGLKWRKFVMIKSKKSAAKHLRSKTK